MRARQMSKHSVAAIATCDPQQALFRHACSQIQNSLNLNQFLESIALSETVMTYCLAARKASLQSHDRNRIRLSGIGALVFELTGIKQHGVRETDRDAVALYLQIMDWSECKQQLLHALLTTSDDTPWPLRYANLEVIAHQGASLVTQLLGLHDAHELAAPLGHIDADEPLAI